MSTESLTREELQALTRAVARLPPRARDALMRVHEGESYAAIAARLNVKPEQVVTLVARAIEYLLLSVSDETCPTTELH